MQPTPAEVITGIRRILKDVVEPSVGSDYARNRLAEVRAVLAQIDWNDSLTHLARDNSAVSDFAGQAADWVNAAPERRAAFAGLLPGLTEAQRPAVDVVEPFAVHNERSEAYSRLMVSLTDCLAAWVREHPADDGAAELLDRIRRHYARLG
ncbi:hypothetical protein LVY72_04785 [Arthrobacter sp. I2-34]|uniref:Uncharacterized protein n=1 Tax=Arthrobacter hankyongi TaxID=2904801 RepID=A0ABS9L3U7_9MICC|nr:hypothetical protein [Arthrobacter hankyongi]MCG2621228.1 hypothetical protein [Arthrobacter hankyongi]